MLVKITKNTLKSLMIMEDTAFMPSEDWRALTIYQIMVGSFMHGDDSAPGYQALWGPDHQRKNGNLKGIIQSLDYIKSLGVNAIWLTPIFDSSEATGGEKLQASGYFCNDYFKIDPHFGTEDDLRELVDRAHERGLYVILDGVFGHHGGVSHPSPAGHTIDSTPTFSDRGEDGGEGNVKYPESLDYFKEVATYWIDKVAISGRPSSVREATITGVRSPRPCVNCATAVAPRESSGACSATWSAKTGATPAVSAHAYIATAD